MLWINPLKLNINRYLQYSSEIFYFLASLDKKILLSIYKDKFSTLVIFRNLPILGKHYILNILYVNKPILVEDLKLFVLDEYLSYHREALFRLRRLSIFETNHILLEKSMRSTIQLCYTFKESLKCIIQGNIYLIKNKKKKKKLRKIFKKTQYLWNQFINCLLEQNHTKENKKHLRKITQRLGLINKKNKITSIGFQFLYESMKARFWKIIIAYIKNYIKEKTKLKEILIFLFHLIYISPGTEVSKSNLTSTQRLLVQELGCLGLLFDVKKRDMKFYSSFLSWKLNCDEKDVKKSTYNGYLIIETTFNVYSYCKSKMHIKLLKELCEMQYRFKNMICGKITKKKVLKLLENGISVRMIVSFLKKYAHPKMTTNGSTLPSNVVNQIKIWNKECERLSLINCFYVCGFSTQKEFEFFKNTIEETEIPLNKTTKMYTKKKILIFLNDEKKIDRYKNEEDRANIHRRIILSKFHLVWYNEKSLSMCLTQKGFKILRRIKGRLTKNNISFNDTKILNLTK